MSGNASEPQQQAMSAITSLVSEIKRRNVFKVITAYAVAAFILLQLCDILFPAVGLQDEHIRYVLIALGVLAPAVILFAWMFEITPEGLKRTRDVTADESIRHFTGQRINHIIIFLLGVALVFFAGEYFFPSEDRVDLADDTPASQDALAEILESGRAVDTRPSIAVLAFDNMSDEKDYFSDGLSEEILNLLANIPELRVAGRTSSFFYKGKNQNLTLIGEELNVDHILEGSVRKSGDQVRITAQLISAEDGFHLWSNTYDREITDVFAVQDEIAGEVTRAMQVTLLSDSISMAKSIETTPEAYDLYLHAKHELYNRTIDSVRRSIDLFQQVIAIDPNYAPAYVNLAVAELLMNWNYNVTSLDVSLENADRALKVAERMEYDTAEYHAIKGLYFSHSGLLKPTDLRLAEDHYARSIEMNPNDVRPYMWWSTLLTEQSSDRDRHERSNELIFKAVQMDPLNRVANGNYSIGLMDLGRIDEAIDNLDRLIRIDPEYENYHSGRALGYITKGDYASGAEAMATVPRDVSQHPFGMFGILFGINDEAAFYGYINQVPDTNPLIDFVHLMENTWDATEAEVRAEAEVLLLKPDFNHIARAIYIPLFRQGDYDLIRRLIENARPDFRNDVPAQNGFNSNDAHIPYLNAIFELGQVERARRYAQHLLEVTGPLRHLGPRGKGPVPVICHIALGDRERAIQELRKAKDAGYLGYYQDQLEDMPLFREIISDPRVQQIRSEIDLALDAQRGPVYEALARQGYSFELRAL
jgi:TolB-like protein